jgi:MFS family permease
VEDVTPRRWRVAFSDASDRSPRFSRWRSTRRATPVAVGFRGASFFSFVFSGTLYMQEVLHYSALQTGLAWLVASVTSMALAGVSQLLVTRIGPRIVMTMGMTLIGVGIVWATQVSVHGEFLANLVGPFVVAGAGTAFSFIPISVAALQGVTEHQSGLASGLLNTSTQFGAAIGTAIASSVAASQTNALLRAGNNLSTALTGGFHRTFWVLGAIALFAPAAIFAIVRRTGPSQAVDQGKGTELQHTVAATN